MSTLVIYIYDDIENVDTENLCVLTNAAWLRHLWKKSRFLFVNTWPKYSTVPGGELFLDSDYIIYIPIN